MSRDVLTVGSTMRIPLLYRGEYSQWSERFMNYLKEQTDGEAMINSIKNGDQPLPCVTQVSIDGTSSTKQPLLKDKSMCHFFSNKKQEFVKSDDKKEYKKAEEKKRNMSKVKCYNCKKKRHFAKDCKKAKVKDYEYYKTKMLLAKKDKDEQVLLAEDHAWMDSNSDYDQEINANMVFMAQIKKVLSDSKKSSSSLEDTITEYEQFTILEEESIDSDFASFNTIITSLIAFDEGKKERVKSIALKAKKESSDDETSTSRSDDEEYAMAGITKALATRDADKNMNDDDNHVSGTCARRTERVTQLALLCVRMFPEESDKFERYVRGLPDVIHRSVVASRPKTMCNKVGHFARDCRSTTNVNTANNQRGNGIDQKPTCYECGSQGCLKKDFPKLKNKNCGTQCGNAIAPTKVYAVGRAGISSDSNFVTRNKILIVHGDESDQGNETRLNIISCTKIQKYMLKGCHAFLAHITTEETKDKSEKKRLEDVPIVQNFPEVFLEDLLGLPLTRQVEF
nr:reverse transcriptase domain-containing protein [Tanacetum cinerariifolium]